MNSASVQDTTYKTACKILRSVPGVDDVLYELPNKHYLEISMLPIYTYPRTVELISKDLTWHEGMKNTGGEDAEVYAPKWGPKGIIQCYMTRKR